MKERRKNILAILPISIGGRLTTSSLIAGFEQNGCCVTVYDELFENNLEEVLLGQYDYIAGFFGSQASIFSRLIYIIVGVATFYFIFMIFKYRGNVKIIDRKKKDTPKYIYEEDRKNDILS